jgi:PhnB protein
MAGDVPPGMPFEGTKGVMLAIEYDTVDAAHSAFAALAEGGQVTILAEGGQVTILAEGGQVTMPMATAFWARTFGMLTDRCGVAWAVNGEPQQF